jgi:hypothetical protein
VGINPLRSVPVSVVDEHGIDTRNWNTNILWCMIYLSEMASYLPSMYILHNQNPVSPLV